MNQSSPAERVSVVSVCFNSNEVVRKMIKTIPPECQIILVDNGSDDIQVLHELTDEANTRLIANDENKGFGSACNQGAQLADRDFLLFQNPDTLLSENTVQEMVLAADRNPSASAFNPRISNENGSPYFKRGSCLISSAEKMPRGWPEQDQEVSILSGASLMVRRKDFEAISGFDPAIFLYHEDDDLALRLRSECGSLMFVRNALVTHAQGQSTATTPTIAALKAFHMGQSRVYTARKHNRSFPFSRALGLAIFQLFSPVVLLSKRKRSKQVAFLKGVLKSSELSSSQNI
ncbi:glycosyltransferase family 2 protein [Sedimentitalea sp. CY04]|uniref:Glycosyltransferase family 2 protein n=1 Tax=Parasedimentitalea denitrificans TaxID=2211118 RepID=A0ABX0W8E0_9RHOB|nr:glycosyltransferase family 2 protein [Sedimentitalea sp. CY04]NIZ61904.1 glycosyltransferase family 2 protein [Sedimentitalea sp. CY04]